MANTTDLTTIKDSTQIIGSTTPIAFTCDPDKKYGIRHLGYLSDLTTQNAAGFAGAAKIASTKTGVAATSPDATSATAVDENRWLLPGDVQYLTRGTTNFTIDCVENNTLLEITVVERILPGEM